MKHINYLQFYLKFIYTNDEYDIKEMKDEIMNNSLTKPDYKTISLLKQRTMSFTEAMMEVINEIRNNPVEVIDYSEPEYVSAKEIQQKLGIDKSTFSIWRKEYGYFKEYTGTDRKRLYPFKDLKELFENHPKGEKFKEKWYG